ncbi:MAG: DUF4179 domain-containing protein [Clostridia bacterium]|nr:DUF4179 domain-containing protein [Clostridia bacterium]
MNRNHEYYQLIDELEENVPDLRPSIKKADDRRKRLTFIYRPLASVAACIAIFVLLVNFSAPVAHACSQVPFLKELAAAVTFSRSLSDAVENEYVQPVALTETQNGITAEIAYIIVDQKQVNVFYRLTSDEYEQCEADTEVLTAEGNRPADCAYSTKSFGAANGELRRMAIDFIGGDVPDKLRVRLSVYGISASEKSEDDWGVEQVGGNYTAEFDFLLEFDPKLTAAGEILTVNRVVEMDGQKITIKQVAVYPTHIRVDVEAHPDNTAWLRALEFYIEADGGMKFEPVSGGLTATGSENSPAVLSYRADSTYFYGAEHLELVITGAQWLRKDMEKTWVNLVTGETGELPDGIAFESAEKTGSTWTVAFRADYSDGEPVYQIFGGKFYDADGVEYEITTRTAGVEPDENGEIVCFVEQFPLCDYPYDEVWLCPNFSHNWTAESEIVITVK